jgi:uncharacterized protein (TIGR02453 family)
MATKTKPGSKAKGTGQAKPAFPGFSPKMQAFFRGLEKNNSREWFTPRKDLFEAEVRGPMVELVTRVNDAFKLFAADYVTATPAKALYRIYRDTRFAKDQTPYKDHVGAMFHRHGLGKNNAAGFYVGVSHKHVEVAGGMYMPGPEELAAVRRAIVADAKTLTKLSTEKRLVNALGPMQGAKLARPPKGFDGAPPDVLDLLRYKQLYFYTLLDADLALTPRLLREVVDRFERLVTFVDWINDAILAARADAEADDARPRRPDPMW